VVYVGGEDVQSNLVWDLGDGVEGCLESGLKGAEKGRNH
jgi:hypothetical protein